MHISVEIDTGKSIQHLFNAEASLTVAEVWERLQETGLCEDNFYITHNGRILYDTDVVSEGRATIVPRLLGGKGGFGSMLRAIGAQIEKTTNREACRDLSGRRLRDINEEKRLKAWIEKQSSREEEAAERKKKKLAKLCAEPKYEFKDQNYERERSVLTERIGDAVEEGFKAALCESSGSKRKIEEEFKPNKRKTILDLDIDSDELDSSDESTDENNLSITKKIRTDVSNDSGHSSDESNKLNNTGANRNQKLEPGSNNEHEHSSSNSSMNDAKSEDTMPECVANTPGSSKSNSNQTCDSTEGTENDSDKDFTKVNQAIAQSSISA